MRDVRIAARHFGADLAAAKEAGLDGVELCVGLEGDALSVSDPAERAEIRRRMAATGLAVCSLSLDPLNRRPVATDPQGPAWLAGAIDAAAELGAEGILVPFFGPADLRDAGRLKAEVVDALVERLAAVAGRAEAAGVALALETTLPAAEKVALLDRIASPAVRCYYDIGNATQAGLDAAEEIRALGGRIGLVHFKDGGDYLGAGRVDMPAVAAALAAVGYAGWIVLETACPSGDRIADCRRNAEFVRRLLS